MLVLSRKLHEKIVINGNITLVVLELNAKGIVRLGIEAPQDVSIVRGELLPKPSKPKSGENQ